ncbi:glutathione S-transferase [Kosakonia sp. H7A]|uniref:glutathione S-transferase n=1 Tax=Kosakonia TaxID=1330547 RepID=UPI000D16F89D|nr:MULTISPECIES: glutathione S-transferase N-terminal domain-containing protein [Kosakonia]MDD7995600.1 glutathione S-transferase N-terminal domain-containing protein [Kosakonia radicincitans]NCF06752.1 glutathione S-transferase family protein [Kosakonia sp. MH5]PTA91902.1 glutathione S-transferase [Kosakonia sp. H7A]
MMQLFFATTSAYVRKVMVCASVLGLADEIERLDSAAHPIERDERIAVFNPLAKVPALRTENGLCLYDSRVICEYLNARAGGDLFPAQGDARWRSLARQALGDGMIDAALLARYEFSARPPEKQWQNWADAQLKKVAAALAEIESQVSSFSAHPNDIGLIAIGCALGYLDFRFAGLNWRAGHPLTAAWFALFDAHPAMAATRPY